MTKPYDLRHKPCPEPVLTVKRLFTENPNLTQLSVMVSDEVNVNNLKRFAINQNLNFKAENQSDYYLLSLSKTNFKPILDHHNDLSNLVKNELPLIKSTTVIFITNDTLGNGEPEFSNTLMDLFLQSLEASEHKPLALLLINRAVLLLSPDSTSRISLDTLQAKNIEILACGLCLEYYKIKEFVPKNQITNMYSIIEMLMTSSKVIKL